MITSTTDAASTALSGLLTAQKRVVQDAQTVATADTGPAGSATAGSSGTKPANPLGALLQNPGSGDNLLGGFVDLIAAKASYKANAAVLKIADDINRKAIDIAS